MNENNNVQLNDNNGDFILKVNSQISSGKGVFDTQSIKQIFLFTYVELIHEIVSFIAAWQHCSVMSRIAINYNQLQSVIHCLVYFACKYALNISDVKKVWDMFELNNTG